MPTWTGQIAQTRRSPDRLPAMSSSTIVVRSRKGISLKGPKLQHTLVRLDILWTVVSEACSRCI